MTQLQTKYIEDAAVTGAKIESSVALAGSPTTTTQASSDDSTKIATTAFVQAVTLAQKLGFEWQDSCIDIVDNTSDPVALETLGNRYLLDNTGASHAGWDGAAAWSIVEFDGTSWLEVVPSTGMFTSIDDEPSSLRMWSGSAWSQKYFESSTASGFLDITAFDITLKNLTDGKIILGDGSNVAQEVTLSGDVTVSNAGVTAIGATKVTEAMLNSDIDAESLVLSAGYAANAGVVAVDDTVEEAVEKIVGNIAALTAPTPNKEALILDGDDITNQYKDLTQVAIANSIMLIPEGGIVQKEGTDYTVSLTGGDGGKTRITFAGDLATGGDAALIATDVLLIDYSYQA